jgi:hypothetical protein
MLGHCSYTFMCDRLTGGEGTPPVRERQLGFSDSAGPIGTTRHCDRRRVARRECVVERVIEQALATFDARIRG